MSDADSKFEILRQSNEQVRARIAVDVLKVVDREDGRTENHLYRLASEYLVTFFGGPPPDRSDPDPEE